MGHFRAGRLPEAEAAFRAVLAAEPGNGTALHLLGFILATTGRREDGLALLDRSIAAHPRNAAFLDNRGQVLMQAGRDEDALRDLEQAVAIDPRSLPAWLHLSQARRRRGHRDAALDAVSRALALDPEHPGARYHEGVLHLERGDHRAAEASLRRVLRHESRNVPALTNLGIVLRKTGRTAEALATFQRAAAGDPENPQALTNLGIALHEHGQSLDAIRHFKRALQLHPDFGRALLNWGNVLRDDGDLDGARLRYSEALAADPECVEAMVNQASALLESERLDEARALYERAAAARPEFADAQAGLAQVQLRDRRFGEAWDNYERRFDTDRPAAVRRALPLPWLVPGDLARGRRVALWTEQGVGDQVLFSTLLPELYRRGMEAVVEVDPRLSGLYRRGLPGVSFVSPPESDAAFTSCDFQLPLGSLPRLFRRDTASFAAQPPSILRADPARVEAYRTQIGSMRTIAIAWRSLHTGNRRAFGERKSIPLEHFAGLAHATGARLLDLQYGDVSEERRAFEARHPGVLVRLEGLDPFSDLEGLAAALVACGRLVSSSNVTAHLAGALGVATQLLYLRGWAPFSYWVSGPGARSLWYPSVGVPAAAWERWEEAFDSLQPRVE
ncbi:MAG: tetratricopeptide repeat protein [Pseudomonadota bacterium]|nr:tetratricopeptide repeat protein [Pseudomonadota bacterium]